MLWWTDDLETGISIVDEQHKNMFDKANEIFDLDPNEDVEKIKKIFTFLMNYSTNHFYEEEQLMIQYEYEDFIEHRDQHNYFVEEIYRIYQNISREEVREDDLNDLKVLIIEWLVNHINGEDKKFIKTMKQ